MTRENYIADTTTKLCLTHTDILTTELMSAAFTTACAMADFLEDKSIAPWSGAMPAIIALEQIIDDLHRNSESKHKREEYQRVIDFIRHARITLVNL